MVQADIVLDRESLLRAIFSPSFFDEDGFLSPSAFELAQLNGKPEKGISVLRKMIEGYEKLLKKISTYPRNKDDSFIFTVELKAKAVREILLKTDKKYLIEVVQTGKNLCHAEIRLSIDGKVIEAGNRSPEYLSFLRHLVILAQDYIQNMSGSVLPLSTMNY